MSRFAGIASDLGEPAKAVKRGTAEADPPAVAVRAANKSRDGKKGILGYFSPELSKALNILALEENTTLQALMGEAFDLLLRNRGKHPFGER